MKVVVSVLLLGHSTMGLWETRKASIELLEKDLSEQRRLIEAAFEIIDTCVGVLNELESNDSYSRICGLTLAKARNYALGAYGMVLDNLGQEAGALMRPFLEYYELLIYFAQEPSRVEEAIDDKLPNAGQRAKIIGSDFKGFRNYLSANASHSSYSLYSMRHLLDPTTAIVKPRQHFAPDVLFRNLGDLFAQLVLLCFQGAICLSVKDYHAGVQLSEQTGRLRDTGGKAFKLAERLDPSYEPRKP